jgi:hypothetical protein
MRQSNSLKSAKFFGRILVFAVGIPGLYVGILSTLPRLAIHPQSSLNLSNPFATPFAISNEGYLEIHDIKASCVYLDIAGSDGSRIESIGPLSKERGGFFSNSMNTDVLEPTVPLTITCPFPFAFLGPITHANIIITVTYRPDFLPFTFQKHKHFVSATSSDGHLQWNEQPMPTSKSN